MDQESVCSRSGVDFGPVADRSKFGWIQCRCWGQRKRRCGVDLGWVGSRHGPITARSRASRNESGDAHRRRSGALDASHLREAGALRPGERRPQSGKAVRWGAGARRWRGHRPRRGSSASRTRAHAPGPINPRPWRPPAGVGGATVSCTAPHGGLPSSRSQARCASTKLEGVIDRFRSRMRLDNRIVQACGRLCRL